MLIHVHTYGDTTTDKVPADRRPDSSAQDGRTLVVGWCQALRKRRWWLQDAQCACAVHYLYTLVSAPPLCVPLLTKPSSSYLRIAKSRQDILAMVGAGRAGQLEGEPRSQAQMSCGFLRQLSCSCPCSSALWRLRCAEAKACSVTRAACLLLQHVAADATLSTALFCKIQAEQQAIAPKRDGERGERDNARLHSVIVGYYLRSSSIRKGGWRL